MEHTEAVPVSPPAEKATPKAAVPRYRRAGGPCTCPQPQLVLTGSARLRLVGTLHGHTMVYTDGGRHTLTQPRRMPKPTIPDDKVPTGRLNASPNTPIRRTAAPGNPG